ncbi:MAG: DNA replication/repair protein RecF [Oscillospiraceae bacterium]|nr:DNA replication/repair protein RecF [Oscillospiraceae bacterium]MBQ8978879.1 DNA replication/repair protein RecF [Oscillospiraceae bacterium]
MIINRVFADGYKNLKDVEIEPSDGLNVILGDNAQGKTNFIEALWIMTGCRSFRGTRDRDHIGFDREKTVIEVGFRDKLREQTIRYSAKKNVKEKEIELNGVKIPLMSRLFGTLKCVVFTPEDLAIAKGPPDNRRTFIDLSASQLKVSFVYALNKYYSILSQRNALIKDIGQGLAPRDQLDIWDDQLARTGAYISVIRDTYCNNLNNYTNSLYNQITNGNEELKLYYQSSIYRDTDVILCGNTDTDGELADIYLSRLRETADDDIRAGHTTCGIHRDDLMIRINDLSVRDFGSQGQQRSAALAMKIAQARIMDQQTGEPPVMLLDDVLSELDVKRQEFVLSNTEGMQIFITCCDERTARVTGRAKIFHVENGHIS